MMTIESLDERGGYFFLRFASEGTSPGAFLEVVTRLKQEVQAHSRTWIPETKVWKILITPMTEKILGRLLPTFEEELRVLRSQMSLL